MVKITNGIIKAEIDNLGAQLSVLDAYGIHYLWDANPDIWAKHGPILFPFVGRLPEGKYNYMGKEYSGVPIHGFSPYADFDCIEKTEDSCTMQMAVTEKIHASYPFDFSFRVKYRLKDNRIEITYIVKNSDSKTMYYGIGSHPGFNIPITEGQNFEDYYIEFPYGNNIKQRLCSEDHFSTEDVRVFPDLHDNRIALRHNLFDNDAIILENTGYKAVIASEKDHRSIVVEYPDTRWCAIWHSCKKEVPFVCIEPWNSLPGFKNSKNELTERNDLNILPSEATGEHRLIITLN